METNIADLKACRLCIETNCNLFDINANKLTNVLDEFTSSTASEMTGLPPYVCLNCFTMLLKATTFRDRCIEIQNYLYECSLIEPLTMDTIQNIDKSKMKNQCNVISEVIIINSIDDDTETVDTKQDVIEIDDLDNNDNDVDGFNEDSSNDYPSSSAIQIEDDIRPVSPNQDDDKDLRQLCAGFNLELIVLSVEEQMEELMARKEKFDDYPYKCEMCFLGYRSERAYRSHLSWHDPSMGPHACDICQRRFSKRRKLNMHLMAHKRKFRCKTCNKRFTGLTEARMHSESHDGRRFDCEHCGKMFTRYRSRLEHIRIHHGAACCDLCYKVYTNTYAVNTHKSRMHREVYTCDLCNTNFNKMTALNRHLDSLNGAPCDTVTPCCACGVNLQNDSALQNHIMSAHRDIRPAPGDKKRKKRCCPCGHKDSDEDTPQYPQDHDYHDLSQNITKIKCDCSCRVRYERNMERKRSRRYMCEVCASDFQSAAALRNHQRTHTGEKPYQCELCPKRFRSNALLKMHVYTHTGERPYKCPFCPKAFGTPANNVRHQLVHTKERPHRCDICDKTFQTSDAVKLHVRTVHMKIPMPPRVRNRKKIVKEQ